VDLNQTVLRLVGVILVVALPALAVLALLLVFGERWVAEAGVGMALLLVGLGTAGWAVVVAWFTARAFAQDVQDVVAIATRGPAPSSTSDPDEGLTGPQRQLSAALEERNRQISTLAEGVVGTSITGGPMDVAARVVGVARKVTSDPTWLLVVLQSADAGALPVGVYGDDRSGQIREVGELERWAAVGGQPERLHPRYLAGPWGAVVVVDTSADDALTAILLAPWEGRPEPTPAEQDLLRLLAQVAAAALEHSILYARLQAQTDDLNRLAAVQTDFLRGVTHDLQTPLTSIQALAADIGSSSGLSREARADLDAITHQADRLRRMVGQLLAASRMEAGALEPRQEVFRAKPVVQRTWDALRAANRPFRLHTTGPDQLVVGDPDRVEQVLWAVLDNAVKYSPAGSPIAVSLGATAGDGEAEGGRWCDIVVTDAGPGMDAEEQGRAFDQFFRSEAARRAAPDGSGIGLYAARGLVLAMGGSMELDSQPGTGTTVRIRLPAEPVGAP